MKNWVIGLLALCLVLGGVIGYVYRDKKAEPVPASPAETERIAGEPEETPDAESADPAAAGEAEETEPFVPEELDMAGLYATHAPEEIVLRADGREETWETYFYFLASQVDYVQNFFVNMNAYYGMPLRWADVAEGDDKTYADMAVEGVEDGLLQFAAIEGFAKQNKVKLTDASREEMARRLQEDIRAVCGEDATEEDFAEYLAGLYISREMYERISTVNLLYQEGFKKLYGDNGEKLSDKEALRYLEENEYLSANHILLMTVDPATGEALEEAEIEKKKAEAERLSKLLQEIKDPAERLERFAELKEEYCEDSGKTAYPAGYTFTPGTMVSEFEEGCKALEDHQVSDPVESSYGCHIIMRLPLDPDAQLSGSDGGAMSARAAAANAAYGQQLQDYLDKLQVDYVEGFELPKLLDYVIEEPAE